MKKLTSLLISCSLALAAAALAQQPEEQQTPKNKKPEKTHQGQPKVEKTVTPEGTPVKQHGGKKERGELNGQKAETTPKSEKSTGTETNVSGEPGASATPGEKVEHGKHGMKEHVGKNEKTTATPAAATSSSVAPVNERNEHDQQANAEGKTKQKPPLEKVHEIKAQHANFHAQPKPDRAPAVTFNASYRIEGSDHWQGRQYEVF